MTIKKNKIPTIIGVLFLIAGTIAGVALVNYRQVFRLGAQGESAPKDIRVSNITDSTLTVSWMTDAETAGFLTWGESQSSTGNIQKESEENIKSTAHSITLTGLEEESAVYFKINSDGISFDNQGIPWQARTGSSLPINRDSILASGSIVTASGQPVKNALVYANVGGYLLSTLSSNTGNFVFQLANVRTSDLANYLPVSESSTLLEISVQSGSNSSSVQIFPQSARPIPPIILGKSYDHRSAAPSREGGVPSALLDLPENQTAQSKLAVPDELTPIESQNVTLDSIDEGEIVTSMDPEFSGTGPKSQEITIKIESENPIEETLNIASNGSWKWSPPTGLAAGIHKITITWKDATGITRSLTRNFVVQAGEAPAFEASESGQTATATPAGTAAATAKSTATPTPKATATATPQPVPETGILTPTLLLSIMGIAIIAFSSFVWKLSDA